MDLQFIRVIRTVSSERFLLRSGAAEIGAVDLHYLPSGQVDGTIIIFDDSGIAESGLPDVLMKIDEVLLPDVSLDGRSLSFTVVMGRVAGAFEPEKKE